MGRGVEGVGLREWGFAGDASRGTHHHDACMVMASCGAGGEEGVLEERDNTIARTGEPTQSEMEPGGRLTMTTRWSRVEARTCSR